MSNRRSGATDIALAPPPPLPPVQTLSNQAKTPLQDTLLSFLTNDFFDPDSAKFRNVREGTFHLSCGDVDAICGEVNAKNRFGAYTGYKLFVVYLPQCWGQSRVTPERMLEGVGLHNAPINNHAPINKTDELASKFADKLIEQVIVDSAKSMGC